MVETSRLQAKKNLWFPSTTCHSGESRNPGKTANNFWMPDRACPQLDWGSGMTSDEVVRHKIKLISINNF